MLGIGTRYADFTTASRTVFQHADVQVVNVNVGARDAGKLGGCALVGDARATLELLSSELADLHVAEAYAARIAGARPRLGGRGRSPRARRRTTPLPTQAQVIGAVNDAAGETRRGRVRRGQHARATCTSSGGRATRPRYHVEYGYSCMGYEVAGGIGVRMAEPEREVFVMVGDGSWLLMSSELVTAAEQGVRVTCVLVDNHGYGSIGGLSRSLGSQGFGTARAVGVDLEANARSLGAEAVRVRTPRRAPVRARRCPSRSASTVVVIECDPLLGVPSYESWWDVPVAEVSEQLPVEEARRTYERELVRERPFY